MGEINFRQEMIEVKIAKYLLKSRENPAKLIAMLLDENRKRKKMELLSNLSNSPIECAHIMGCSDRTVFRLINKTGLKG